LSESPFFPGTQIQYAFDSTSLGWYKECPRKYEYSMLRGYTTKTEQVNLLFGIWFHSALERYYKLRAQALPHEESLEEVTYLALCETWYSRPAKAYDGPWQSDHATKTRDTLIRSIIWYLDEWGPSDPCKTVILENGKPAVELSFSFDIGNNLLLSGHLDRLVSFAGDYFVLDHKTSSSTITGYYFDQYKPDNQMSLYTLATQVIYNTPVKGVMIDATQVAVGFSKTTRGFTYRTPAELEEWLEDTRDTIADIHRDAERGYFRMNDRSCHKYGGCPFRKVCGSDPSVREMLLKSEYTIKHWNPLESR